MLAVNIHHAIRAARPEDADVLQRLAERGSQPPLTGVVLVAQIAGVVRAALSRTDGRTIADPSLHTAHLVAALRVQARAMRALEATPSLGERVLAGIRIPRAAGHNAA